MRYYLMRCRLWLTCSAVALQAHHRTRAVISRSCRPRCRGELPQGGAHDAPTPCVWVIARTQATVPETKTGFEPFAGLPSRSHRCRGGGSRRSGSRRHDPAVDMITSPVEQVSPIPAAA